eukprot:UN03172
MQNTVPPLHSVTKSNTNPQQPLPGHKSSKLKSQAKAKKEQRKDIITWQMSMRCNLFIRNSIYLSIYLL